VNHARAKALPLTDPDPRARALAALTADGFELEEDPPDSGPRVSDLVFREEAIANGARSKGPAALCKYCGAWSHSARGHRRFVQLRDLRAAAAPDEGP